MATAVYLLVLAIAVGWLASRIRVAYPIVMVIAGVAAGLLPFTPSLVVSPRLLLSIVLPAALYPAAIDTSFREFRRNLRPILLLAVGFVLVTTVAVAVALRALVPDVPWPAAIAFGAIVSPPDSVAASAILRRFPLPRRVTAILEGESLVNDASGLVLYRFAVAAILTGSFSPGMLLVRFVVVGGGGVLLGIALGWVTSRIQERLRDPMLEVTTSLTTPFLTYTLCESLGLSGVLGVVTVGLYRAGWGHLRSTPETRLNVRVVWRTVLFLVNCFVFCYLGLRLPALVRALAAAPPVRSWGELIGIGLAMGLVVIVVRFVWVFPGAYLPWWLLRKRHPQEGRPPLGVIALISWCGMRGIVSLAIAIALPRQLPDGTPFALRELLIFLTLCVIVITLVGQGLTLPWVVRALALPADEGTGSEENIARAALRDAAVRSLDQVVKEEGLPVTATLWIRRFLSASPDHTHRADGGILDVSPEARLWMIALDAQRRELLNLWRDGWIGDEVLRHLERELDLLAARTMHHQV